jgi:PAS domain S-box-containing protein
MNDDALGGPSYISILNSINQGVICFDYRGDANYINSVGLELLGYKREDIIGLPVHIIIHHSKQNGSIYPKDECPIMRIATSGRDLYGINEIFWNKEGEAIAVDVYGSPLYKEENIIGGVISFNKRRDQQLLQHSEIHFGHFPTENPNPVFRVDIDGLLQYGNAASFNILEAWKITVGETLPGSDLLQEIKESIKSGLFKEFITSVDSEKYEFSIRPFPTNHSAIIYGQNITKWIKAEPETDEGYAIDNL